MSAIIDSLVDSLTTPPTNSPYSYTLTNCPKGGGFQYNMYKHGKLFFIGHGNDSDTLRDLADTHLRSLQAGLPYTLLKDKGLKL